MQSHRYNRVSRVMVGEEQGGQVAVVVIRSHQILAMIVIFGFE